MIDCNSNQFSSLFLTLQKPYPPVGGAPLRNWQIINAMLQFGAVDVISIVYENSQDDMIATCPPGIELYKEFHTKKNFQNRTFWQKIQNRLWWLNSLTHPKLFWLYSNMVTQELLHLIGSRKPNIVIFSDVRFYHYYHIIQKNLKFKPYFIYLSHNVEGDLSTVIFDSTPTKKTQKIIQSWENRLLPQRIRSIENKFFRQANQVWVCSDDDAQLMQKLYGKSPKIKVIPNGINLDEYKNIRLDTASLPENWISNPHTIIFTATFCYQPNSIAAQVLTAQIYPRLQEIYPDSYLLLVGREPTPQMIEAAKNNSGIIVTGKVPDVRPYLAAASVVVVPLLEGGGTRLKILEAFAAKRPVVSTSKGAEGLKVKDGEHLLIKDSIDDIIAGIDQLWSNPALGQKQVDAAYQLVKEKYSWQAVDYRVNQAIDDLIN